MTKPAKSFWRNVILIALAHVALIAGLIRWSAAARASSNPENIVWLGSAENLAAAEQQDDATLAQKRSGLNPASEPLKDDETEEKKTGATAVKSEIELPSPTPEPTPRATPASKPTAAPSPKPRPTPKPISKSRKTSAAKASPSPSRKGKPQSHKERRSPDRSATPSHGTAKAASSGKNASAGGGNASSEFAWYGDMLHDRFYRAWIQPTTSVARGAKISTLVRVRIEKDGRVTKFEIIKPSGNAAVNESVRVVGKQVTQV
ncbi:MAG: hypothetical protein C4293_05750, partial [Nitrospiraceae bacterium]